HVAAGRRLRRRRGGCGDDLWMGGLGLLAQLCRAGDPGHLRAAHPRTISDTRRVDDLDHQSGDPIGHRGHTPAPPVARLEGGMRRIEGNLAPDAAPAADDPLARVLALESELRTTQSLLAARDAAVRTLPGRL